jgi:hypothetical protein
MEFTDLELELLKCIKEHVYANAELFGHPQEVFDKTVKGLKEKGVADGHAVEEDGYISAYFTEYWRKKLLSQP